MNAKHIVEKLLEYEDDGEDDILIGGKTWAEIQAMQQGTYVSRPLGNNPKNDTDCIMLGNDEYQMIPSGDIVNKSEKQRRLGR